MAGKRALKTGNDFIAHAAEKGAQVEPGHRKRGIDFTKVSTEEDGVQQSVFITPGTQPLDLRTRKNYVHWFKLLGLMALGFVTHPFWLPILRNFLWSNWQIIL